MSEKLRGLPVPEECNKLNGISLANYLLERKVVIFQALKLQELVKEWIEETKQPLPEGHIPIVSLNGVRIKLQSLVEESEK